MSNHDANTDAKCLHQTRIPRILAVDALVICLHGLIQKQSVSSTTRAHGIDSSG